MKVISKVMTSVKNTNYSLKTNSCRQTLQNPVYANGVITKHMSITLFLSDYLVKDGGLIKIF